MGTCNHCNGSIEPGKGTWYERDQEDHGVSGVGYKTHEFVLCPKCDNKLMDGELNFKEVSATNKGRQTP